MRGLVSEKSAGPRDDVLGAMVASVVTNLGDGRALVENVTNDGVAGSCFTIKLTTSRGFSWLSTMPLNERERIWPGKTCRLSELPWDGSEPLPYKILHRKELWEPKPVKNSPFTSSRVQRVAEWVDWDPKDGPSQIRAKLASLQTKLEGVYHLTDHAAMPEKRTFSEIVKRVLASMVDATYSPLNLLHNGRFQSGRYDGQGMCRMASLPENQTSLEMLGDVGSAVYNTLEENHEMQWTALSAHGDVRLTARVPSSAQQEDYNPFFRQRESDVVSFVHTQMDPKTWRSKLDAFHVQAADLARKGPVNE